MIVGRKKLTTTIFLLLLLVKTLGGEELKQIKSCCPILELRQYNLVPGKREEMIQLFDAYFIESQEETGMLVVGQFRDTQNPDHFVWVRGFKDMESREKALNQFYFESNAWKEHKTAANTTMVDVNNVLLLRPARQASGFQLSEIERPALNHPVNSERLIVATIYYFDKDFLIEEFVGAFEKHLIPAIQQSGIVLISYLVTEHSKNTFPRLPVREDANVFIWWTSFNNREEYNAFRRSTEKIRLSGKSIPEFLKQQGMRSVEYLELTATSRSLLR